MTHTQMMQSTQKINWIKSGKWSACLLLAAIAGGLVVYWPADQDTSPTEATQPAPAVAPAASPAATPAPVIITPATPQIVARQQAVAAGAVVRQVGVKPVSGHITQRPDFVSEIEWQVLQGVARQSTDSDQTLTQLVNKLRFSKQLDMWHSLAGSADIYQRHALATQLLDDIPARVANKEMDFTEAQKLQQDLLADLVSDPQQRNARAAQEEKRLTGLYVTEGSAAGSGKQGG